jgi:phenylacetate-coenzyme A ligase PaaK-like adenylate-forming protein
VFPIDAPLPKLVEDLNQFAPMLLHGYPTFIEVLCAEKRRGALRIEPEIVSCGSEPTSQAVRDAVRAAFPSARLVDSYASTECLALGTTCPLGEMHQNEDACVLEPVDDAHRPVPDGQRASRVLVTNLFNTVQPLVRYELTDSIELLPGRCACGSAFRRMRVHGRTDDTIYLVDGAGQAQAHPPIPLEIAFLGVQGLAQYQLVHERQNQLRAFFVADPGADPQVVADRIDAQLAGYLGGHGLLEHVTFAVEQVESIERHARSKKLRQITSRVPRPDAAVVSALSQRRS